MFSVAIELGASGVRRHYRPLPVAAELRGYAGERSQVRVDTSKGKLVSITGLSARFCPTGRDIYLEKIVQVDTLSWERWVLGKVVDSVLVDLHKIGMEEMENAFETAIHDGKAVSLDQLQARILSAGNEAIRKSLLVDWRYEGKDRGLTGATIEAFAERVVGGAGAADLIENTLYAILDLVRYETDIFITYLRQRRRRPLGLGSLSRSTGWMGEARAVLLRLQTGVKLDKNDEQPRVFGISAGVRPDFLYAVTLIGDLKTGQYHQFYEGVATGYAIFAESVLQRRINTAVILAVDFDLPNRKLRSHQVIPVTTDNEQRQLWITQRDFALKVLRSDSPPQHPDDINPCGVCPYVQHCWEGGHPGGTPLTPDAPPRRAHGIEAQ